MSNHKPYKPKQDRYDKLNKSSMMMLNDLSQIGNSVGTIPTLDTSVGKEQQSQCRICLHSEDQIGGKELFSVCKCTGSVKYLHEHCFILWVNKLLQQKNLYQRRKIISQGNTCQLCKFLIPIKSQTLNECTSCSLLKLRIKSRPFLFSILIAIQILCLALISFIINMMMKLSVGFDSQRIATSLISICILVVFGCLGVVVGYSFVNDYFIREKNVVVGFGDEVRSVNMGNDNRDALNRSSHPSDFNPMISKKVLPQPLNMDITLSQQYQPQTSIRIQPAGSQSNENVLQINSSLSNLSP